MLVVLLVVSKLFFVLFLAEEYWLFVFDTRLNPFGPSKLKTNFIETQVH